jgi:glycosyltransferase involved in cell wall biosynthesis
METAPLTVDVSVLVPVLNEGRRIREVVDAMLAQQFDGSVEFLFADGCSTDDTREQLATDDPRIRLLDNPRRGTASGLNVCLREARGQYVARMDGHTIYPSNYLQSGVDRLARGDVSWVAGPQIPAPRGLFARGVAAALRSRLGQGGSRRWSRPGGDEYDLDTGVFCGVWRRADVIRHGGWDEGWPRNQDSELAARFLASGERIVSIGAMAAQYIPRDSPRSLWRQYRDYGSYRAKTALRHPTSLRRSAVLPPLLVLDAIASIVAPVQSVRRLARAAVGLYAGALAVIAWEVAREDDAAVAAVAPVALATMHVAHGVGFISGCRRWGIPRAALVNLLRGEKPSSARPYDGSIEAPSLHGPTDDQRHTAPPARPSEGLR